MLGVRGVEADKGRDTSGFALGKHRVTSPVKVVFSFTKKFLETPEDKSGSELHQWMRWQMHGIPASGSSETVGQLLAAHSCGVASGSEVQEMRASGVCTRGRGA